ncbi:helix-turn-helix domain-containing protein [Psychroserpens jangbogonensis]|uniref:helix-turn-helix domain-containing protein n=1 Tax=Psychroserpens jangbogonensis TaxID=1484460 RepID=UPI00068B61E8|nr:helix-turn-helix domain-containing protein [Psychroserpens jangbogonensis]
MQNESLGSKVRDSRKKLGLSQEALAEKSNVSLSTIQRIEKGTVKPRGFTINILAETLELDASELLSKFEEKDTPISYFSALKRMNLFTLLLVFIPFINLCIPFIFWKTNKEIHPKDNIAGKMLSFQLLWSLFTVIGMLISLLVTNLIVGKAGLGLYTSNTVYLLAVVFNIFMIAKTSSQLSKENKNSLSFVPNLF